MTNDNYKYNKYNDIEMYHDLIESIIAALEARDINTANHSQRVSDMTEQVCKLMKLPRKEMVAIHMAAHVHDIGKIGISDKILMKPDALNKEEWELIKTHPQIGANILNKSKGLYEVSDIVLHHHERWDGKGYPNKIKKEKIPFGSRIIALCDSIDAMMSKRVYKEPASSDSCKKEIQLGSGFMYDPDIADFMVKNWNLIVEQIKFI